MITIKYKIRNECEDEAESVAGQIQHQELLSPTLD